MNVKALRGDVKHVKHDGLRTAEYFRNYDKNVITDVALAQKKQWMDKWSVRFGLPTAKGCVVALEQESSATKIPHSFQKVCQYQLRQLLTCAGVTNLKVKVLFYLHSSFTLLSLRNTKWHD